MGNMLAGTLVAMGNGTYQAIEKVKAGDWVLSKDEASGKVEKKQVENNTVRCVATTLLLTFSDGSQVETTDEHPLYVEGQGFKAAKEVGIGTSIVTRAGPSLRVTNVEHREGTTLVYNLTVEGFHTYFVGNDLWVHNNGDCGGGGNPDTTTGEGYSPSDPPVRIQGPWRKGDLHQGLMGKPPRELGRPDLHHAEQMPGSAIHEVVPELHRGNTELHGNKFNQGVTDLMRAQDRQLHWWYRAQEQGAGSVYPHFVYD